MLPDYGVAHCQKLGLATKTDAEIYEAAQLSKWLIITFDEDFADRRVFAGGDHYGIIRLRVEPTTADVTLQALGRLFAAYRPSELRGRLAIVQEVRIRVIPGH